MRLTQFSNFAVRILMYAGLKESKTSAVSEMARAYGVSQDHLKKAAAELCQIGTLESVRGRRGGVRLAVPAKKINIGSIVRKTETTNSLVDCFDEETSSCPIADTCKFRLALNEAVEAFFSVLDKYTLDDFITDRREALALRLSLANTPRSETEDQHAVTLEEKQCRYRA